MRRGVPIAGASALLAIAAWRAARILPPARVSMREERQALAKLRTLEDILRSKNDNDPRLDRDFKDLTPQAKRLLRRKYGEIPPERRNERGTIVYLLGMSLDSGEDWAFLRGVVSEPPCLSLADCASKAQSAAGEHSWGDEVTLAYPSLVALRQAQRALEQARADGGASSAAAQEALAVIRAAKGSKMPAVARMVSRIETQRLQK